MFQGLQEDFAEYRPFSKVLLQLSRRADNVFFFPTTHSKTFGDDSQTMEIFLGVVGGFYLVFLW